METRLGTIFKSPNGSEVNFFDVLSQNQYDQYREALKIIGELQSNRRLLDIFLLNHNEFNDFFEPALKELIEKSQTSQGIVNKDGDQIVLITNRLLLNYLSSARTFLDHSETFLKRKFGPTANEFLEFKNHLKHCYDNYFTYRFFYKLRNYSQHCGLPLEFFSIKAETKGDGKVYFEMRVGFDKKKLLSNFDWGSQITRDLQSINLVFDVHPLIFEMTSIIQSISNKIEAIININVVESATFINKLTKHLRKDQVQVSLFKNIKEGKKGKPLSYQMEIIPFEVIDSITT